MPADETAATPTPWYRNVAIAVCWFLLLPTVPLVLAILLALGLYAGIENFISELLFCARMRQRGRFLCRRELSTRIAEEGSGTLIVESPTLGWGFTHAWWTPEKVPVVCPHPLPSHDDYRRALEKMQCLDRDRWLWDNYTDPEKGRAFLLRVWNGRSLQRWINRNFPDVIVIKTNTALVQAPTPTGESLGA